MSENNTKTIKVTSKIVRVEVKQEDLTIEQPTGSKVEDAIRPQGLRGFTYEIKSPADIHSTFVTINDIERNGLYRPYEIFIHSKNPEHTQWVMALYGLLSTIFRHEMNPYFVIKELLEVEDPKNGSYFAQGKRVPSNVAHIGMVVFEHLERLTEENKKVLENS